MYALRPPGLFTKDVATKVLRFPLFRLLAPRLSGRLLAEMDERWNRVILGYSEVSHGRIVLPNSEARRVAAGRFFSDVVQRVWGPDAPSGPDPSLIGNKRVCVEFVSNEKAINRLPYFPAESLGAPCAWDRDNDTILIKEEALRIPGLPIPSRRLARWVGGNLGERNFRLAVFCAHECNERYLTLRGDSALSRFARFVAKRLLKDHHDDVDLIRETAANVLSWFAPPWSKHSVFRLFSIVRGYDKEPPVPVGIIVDAYEERWSSLPDAVRLRPSTLKEHTSFLLALEATPQAQSEKRSPLALFTPNPTLNSELAWTAAQFGLPVGLRHLGAALLLGLTKSQHDELRGSPVAKQPRVTDEVLALTRTLEKALVPPHEIFIATDKDRIHRDVEKYLAFEVLRIKVLAERGQRSLQDRRSGTWGGGDLLALYGAALQRFISELSTAERLDADFVRRITTHARVVGPLCGILGLTKLHHGLRHEAFRVAHADEYDRINLMVRNALGMAFDESQVWERSFRKRLPSLLTLALLRESQDFPEAAIKEFGFRCAFEITEASLLHQRTPLPDFDEEEFGRHFKSFVENLNQPAKEELHRSLLERAHEVAPHTFPLSEFRVTGTVKGIVAIQRKLHASTVVQFALEALWPIDSDAAFRLCDTVSSLIPPDRVDKILAEVFQDFSLPSDLLIQAVRSRGGEKAYESTWFKEKRELAKGPARARPVESLPDLIRSELVVSDHSLAVLHRAILRSKVGATRENPPVFGGLLLADQQVEGKEPAFIKTERISRERVDKLKLVVHRPHPTRRGELLAHEVQLITETFEGIVNSGTGLPGTERHEIYKLGEETRATFPGQEISLTIPSMERSLNVNFQRLSTQFDRATLVGIVANPKSIEEVLREGQMKPPIVHLCKLPKGATALSLLCTPKLSHLFTGDPDPFQWNLQEIESSPYRGRATEPYFRTVELDTTADLLPHDPLTQAGVYVPTRQIRPRFTSEELEQALVREPYMRAKLILREIAVARDAEIRGRPRKPALDEYRRRAREAGLRILAEEYGIQYAKDVDRDLILRVFRPMAHDFELRNEEELFRILGSTDLHGAPFMNFAEVRGWVERKFVPIEVERTGERTLKVSFGADRRGVINIAVQLLAETGADFEQARAINTPQERALEVLVYPSQRFKIDDLRQRLLRLRLLADRRSHLSLTNGVRTRLEAFVRNQPGVLSKIVGLVDKAGLSVEDLNSFVPDNEKSSDSQLLFLELSGPDDYAENREVPEETLDRIRKFYLELFNMKIVIPTQDSAVPEQIVPLFSHHPGNSSVAVPVMSSAFDCYLQSGSSGVWASLAFEEQLSP